MRPYQLIHPFARFRNLVLVLLALALAGAVAGGTRAAAAGDGPQSFVQSIGDDVVRILQQKLPRDETERRLNDVWLKAFDVAGIGRTVLGTHWKAASDQQRQAYMDVFPKYVARLYAIQFSDYAGETFAVGESVPLAAGTTLVRAKIIRPDRDPIRVDFVVGAGAQGMQVEDVKVEGISLLITKRTEFDSVVAQKGIDGLIQALREKAG